MLKTLNDDETKAKIQSIAADFSKKNDRASTNKVSTSSVLDQMVADSAKDLKAADVPALRKKLEYTIHFLYGGVDTSWKYNTMDHPIHDFTQSGLADRITDMAKDHLFYDADRGIWRIWNGKFWVKVGQKNTSDLFQIASQLPVMIKNEGSYELVSKGVIDLTLTQFTAFQRSAGSKNTLSAAFDLCKSEQRLGRTRVQYDKDQYLLNFENGELPIANVDNNGDLIKGSRKLQNHDKSNYSTTIIPYNYDPKAKAPRFIKFLNSFAGGSQEMAEYLQLIAGYTLFGQNIWEHFFLLHGAGSTGKSTFLKILASCLGGDDVEDEEIAQSVSGIPFNLFTNAKISDANANTPALARLSGKLLAITTEPNKNDTLDEGFVKSAVGRDTLTATRKYEQPFAFQPRFKIFIATNDYPKSSASDAILRRMIMIPANHVVRSKNLDFNANLVDQVKAAEMQGVLAWMVQGAEKLIDLAIEQANKAKQVKQDIKSGKIDPKDAPIIEKDPLMLKMPIEVRKEGLHYATSANSAALFLQDLLITKEEYWNKIATSKALDPQVAFSPASFKRNGAPSSQKGTNREERYAKDQDVVIDKNSYVLRRDLYEVYRDYCKTEGIEHKMTSKHFADVIKQYLPSAHTSQGTAWLGIALSPAFNYGWHEGNYGESVEIIRKSLWSSDKNHTGNVLDMFAMLNSNRHIGEKQQAKIEDFIKNHDGAYLQGSHEKVTKLYNPVMRHYDDIEEAKKQRIKKAQHAMFD